MKLKTSKENMMMTDFTYWRREIFTTHSEFTSTNKGSTSTGVNTTSKGFMYSLF